MSELYLPVLLGTTRPQRKSIHAARFITEVGAGIPGVRTELVDPTDFNFPFDGDDAECKDARYTALTAAADGFFIVTPEYNHSIPSSLKRMLDSEFDNYHRKPVALAGVSSGQWGGVRAIEQLALSVRTMGMVSLPRDVHFPKVQDLLDESGAIQSDEYHTHATAIWHDLIWMAHALKTAKNASKA